MTNVRYFKFELDSYFTSLKLVVMTIGYLNLKIMFRNKKVDAPHPPLNHFESNFIAKILFADRTRDNPLTFKLNISCELPIF